MIKNTDAINRMAVKERYLFFTVGSLYYNGARDKKVL